MVRDPNPEMNEGSPPVWAIDATELGEDQLEVLKNGGEGGREFADARSSASCWEAWEAGVFAVGRSLTDWNYRNKFCAGCGSKVVSLLLFSRGQRVDPDLT